MILRLQKLLELSRRGDPGEKDSAKRILDKLLAKHGLTYEDIDSPIKRRYRFKDRFEKILLIQVVYMVVGNPSVSCYSSKGRKQLTFELTASQAAEVSTAYGQYIRSWRKLQDNTLDAFIVKNQILPDSKEEKSDITYTKEQIEEWRRILKIAQVINYTSIRKALT